MTSSMTISKNGRKKWRDEKGALHREEGPAVEGEDGFKQWWLHGVRHREDGPAVEYVDGTKEWWIKGELLTPQQFAEKSAEMALQRQKEIVEQAEKKATLIASAEQMCRNGISTPTRKMQKIKIFRAGGFSS